MKTKLAIAFGFGNAAVSPHRLAKSFLQSVRYSNMARQESALEMRGINKSFTGNEVLVDIGLPAAIGTSGS